MTDTALKPQLLRQYRDAGANFVLLRKWDATVKRTGKEAGKAPLSKDWPLEKVSYDQALKHMERGNNVGVQMSTAGFCVLDYDPRNDPGAGTEDNALAKIIRDAGMRFDGQCTVQTGNMEGKVRGTHIYLKIDPEWRGRTTLDKDSPYPGVELKHSAGQQVVAAGSKHPSGGLYMWKKGSAPLKQAVEAPQALLDIFKRSEPTHTGQGTASWGAFEPEEIERALSHLDPEDYGSNDPWFELMCSVHWMSGGDAAYEFIKWSTSDPRYEGDGEDIQFRWDSLKHDHTQPIRAGVFFNALKKAGVDPDDFPREKLEFLYPDMDDLELDLNEGQESPQIRALREMNRKHALVMGSGKVFYLCRLPDPLTGQDEVTFYDAKSMRELYANEEIAVPRNTAKGVVMEPTSAFEFWQKHPQRRQYHGMEFLPDGDPERIVNGKPILNLWDGWPYSTVKRGNGDWSLLDEMIRRNICDDDQERYDYLIRFLAYSIQHANDRQQISFVMRGPRGTGKGTLANYWIDLFGTAGHATDDAEDLLGRFNIGMERTCALFLDEAIWAGDVKLQNKLQSRITEKTIRVEEKYMPTRRVRNYLTIMMATNERWAVPAAEDERRYVVYDVVQNWSQGDPFFGRLKRQMNDGGRQAFFYDLYTMDLGDFTPIRNYPRTDALRDQVKATLGDMATWWIGLLEHGALPDQLTRKGQNRGSRGVNHEMGDWGKGPVAVPMLSLRDSFKSFLDNAGSMGEFKYDFESKFTHKLSRVIPDNVKMRVKVQYPPEDDDMEFAHLQRLGDGRVKCYIFPPLEQCRAHAREMFGDVFARDDDDEDDEFM